jgi:hypothetical protein
MIHLNRSDLGCCTVPPLEGGSSPQPSVKFAVRFGRHCGKILSRNAFLQRIGRTSAAAILETHATEYEGAKHSLAIEHSRSLKSSGRAPLGNQSTVGSLACPKSGPPRANLTLGIGECNESSRKKSADGRQKAKTRGSGSAGLLPTANN